MTETADRSPIYHVHPRNPDAKVYGIRLVAGDILQEGDVYDSTKGSWESGQFAGMTLQDGATAVWVRPVLDTRFVSQ